MAKKSILITGAASGIGRETALLFAQRDWYVGIFDVNRKGLQELEPRLGDGNCFAQVMDVTDPDNVQRAIDAFADAAGGRINVLLNNAGIVKFGFFEKMNLADHLKIVDVNFKGCLNCIYFSLPYLKKTPDARIINMSSLSSVYGIPDLAVYSATKHALSAITEALDIELEKSGIKVCDIKPPYVNTPLLDTTEAVYSIEKTGVHMQPEQIAECIWKAAHQYKLHWKIGSTRLLAFACWMLPFARRFIVKMSTIPPQ